MLPVKLIARYTNFGVWLADGHVFIAAMPDRISGLRFNPSLEPDSRSGIETAHC